MLVPLFYEIKECQEEFADKIKEQLRNRLENLTFLKGLRNNRVIQPERFSTCSSKTELS